jgi:peptidyl-tRNA hydrolase, PTH1 family
VVEELARRWGISADHLECNALVGRGVEGRPWLARPQTYMNRSGYAARCLLERYGLDPAEILVVYDEINLPLGRLRLRRSGSPAGHRGLESILENLRTDEIPRLRLGIASESGVPAGEDLPDFVLAPFTGDEQETVAEMIRRAADACEVWVGEGVEVAMNRFNG